MDKKGISLTEVMIVVGILSISMLFGMRVFINYFKANIYVSEKAIETVLATERIEEWKSVGGENFIPGVQVPLFYTSVNSTSGYITFTRSLVTIPVVTQLAVNCQTNITTTQNTGYSYSLTQGGYGDAGSGNNCWFDPQTRPVGDHTAGNVQFTINVPTGISCTLSMNLVDLGTKLREERVIVNNIIKASYTVAQLVSPTGQTLNVNLTSNDTSSGTINVEIEQTNATYVIAGNTLILDDCNDTSWVESPPSITLTNPSTPGAPLPYTESDGKALYVDGPGSSGESIYRNFNTSTAVIGDTITAWVRLDADTSGGIQVKMTLPSGDSNTVTNVISGWQQLTKILTAADIGSSTRIYFYFGQTTGPPNTHDRFHINEIILNYAIPNSNINAVISSWAVKSLVGFTDPDSSAGAPVPPPGTNPPYIITTSLTPSESVPGAALGWIVTVGVNKSGSKYKPVTISNTINR